MPPQRQPPGAQATVCSLIRLGAFALVGAGIGWGLANSAVQSQQREKAAGWLQIADDVVPGEIDKLEAANQSLGLLIQQANGRFGESELARYAPNVLRNLAPGSAVSLAPRGVLQAFHPKPSNTDWLGVNVIEHPRFKRSSSLALQKRDSVLQGPVQLLKGGTGIVVATPVFVGPEKQFWGLVRAVGPWSTWLSRLEAKAQKNDPPMRFGLEIRDSEGITYRCKHSKTIDEKGVRGEAIQVPGGTVTLTAMQARLTGSQSALLGLAPLTGASIGAGVSLALCQRRRQQQLVQMALQLESAQAKEGYQALFEESLDPVSVINREPRFIEANPRVATMYGAASTAAFLQCNVLDFSPEFQPDGRPSAVVAMERIEEAFEKGAVEFEYLHRRMDTGELWLGQVSLRRIELNGEPVLITRVRDITESRRYEQRIEDLAFCDSLTHLPNRIAAQDWFERQLEQEQNPNQFWLVINLDIDDFRSINEAFGQDVGNQVICWVADTLAAALPPTACLARLGSDEFVVVLPIHNGTPPESLEEQAQRWARTLQYQASEAVGKQGSSVPRISLSAGCTIVSRSSTASALAAMQQANTALQQAKDSGRGGVQLYSSTLSALIQERLNLEKELEQALAPEQSKHAFRLLFQPQVRRSGRVVRAEALLRFRAASGFEISPDVFIPVAERSGQIHRLGRWVLETAIRQQALWRDQGLSLLPLSVNISARQLDDLPGTPTLLEQLQECLRRYQLEPQSIVLELTETALLKDERHIKIQLQQLVSAGFRLALDDFGTGYSSLAVLRDYPVSQVKIDKGFTKHAGLDPRSCSIVEALVAICRVRRMDLVAEGVETSEQREALIHLGVQLFQGYLFAPGLEADAFAQFLLDPGILTRGDRDLFVA